MVQFARSKTGTTSTGLNPCKDYRDKKRHSSDDDDDYDETLEIREGTFS